MKKSEFKPHEVIGYLEIDGRRVTYLKPGVKRLRRYPVTASDDYARHINQELVYFERWQKFAKSVLGIDNFDINASLG